MAQITTVTSEALQATLRRLLPSQQGFGEDLQASNVITPIIDLTPSAEGSILPDYLQTALTLTDATVFASNNNTVSIVSTAGFYRVIGSFTIRTSTAGDATCDLRITDGTTTKDVLSLTADASAETMAVLPIDCVVLIQSGETLQTVTNRAYAFSQGSVRQIADINGNLVNPSGFVSQ